MDNYECYNCMWEGTEEEVSSVMVDNPNLPSILEERICCPTCKDYESLVNVDEERRYEDSAHLNFYSHGL